MNTQDEFGRGLRSVVKSALCLTFALTACDQDAPLAGSAASAEQVKVEFFVMSQCPYGKQVEDAFAPVLEKLGASLDFSLDFIGQEKGGKLVSMHGDNEVKGDKIQLCAAKTSPGKYMKLISCMNENTRSIPKGWDACARKAGLEIEKIRACSEGEEGTALLAASFDRAKRRKARGSPTIFVAGQPYRGKRTELEFTRAICAAYTKSPPKLCANIPKPPPPVKVPITVLTDSRCRECQASTWEKRLKGLFPGAVIKTMDYGHEEGRKLYTDQGLKLLPAVLLGEEVKKAENYTRIRRNLQPQGKFLALRVGAKFDPTKEICDNGKDDTDNGKVDCKDPDCTDALVCRKEIPGKLDIFVMSQCPYGVKALDSMKEVLGNFENRIQFDVHYIASAMDDGFKSLHGQSEVDEDIRELCAIKYHGKDDKFMDYILCRNKSIRSTDWRSCTGDNGIDTRKLEKCSEGEEGKRLLRQDIKLGGALGISASPTWLANNKFKFSGVDAESIKQNLCRHNPGLKNCDRKLTGPNRGGRKGSCNCGGGGSCK